MSVKGDRRFEQFEQLLWPRFRKWSVARIPRHQLCETCLRPGTLYHVTNRGAGRRDLFHSFEDRLVFLSALADACRRYGLLVHAYCLMSNHIHLLIEDARGCLSQAMSLTQSVYARYFNDSCGARGSGHLFGDRFFCEVVSSATYYDRLASYILLNPLRCATPLAASAEDYPWSSAALHCGLLTPSAFFAHLIEQHGGVNSLLAAMPKPSTSEVARNRRARVDALLSGTWISPDAVRCGRSPGQMHYLLRRRAGMPRPEPTCDSGNVDCVDPTIHQARLDGPPRAAAVFTGTALAAALGPLQDACVLSVPAGEFASTQVVPYFIWRFCSASTRQIAKTLGRAIDEVARAVASVRQWRTTMPAWETVLSRAEWQLRWRLACGPHRA